MLAAVLGLSLVFLSACGSEQATDLGNNSQTAPYSNNAVNSNNQTNQTNPTNQAASTTPEAAAPVKTMNYELKDGTYKAEVATSQLDWEAGKIIGDPHTGTAPIKSGQLEVKNGLLTSGSFVIDMTKITNDQKIDALLKHLSSDDFFAVATYPEARFVITNATLTPEAGQYLIKGNLTIKDKTAPATFKAQVSEDNGLLAATSSFSIDRTVWNIKYGSGKFFQNLGDKTVKDEIKFKINLQAKQ